MIRLALTIIVIGTLLGALMPGRNQPPAASHEDNVFEVSEPAPNPSAAPASQGGIVSLQRSPDGHFYADATVNGAPVRFLVDTGASGVALSRADALRAAIPLSPDMVDVIGRGASGDIRGEFVRIDRVELGNETAQGVVAAVMEGGDQSLLGQSFLKRFDSVEIEGDIMTLR